MLAEAEIMVLELLGQERSKVALSVVQVEVEAEMDQMTIQETTVPEQTDVGYLGTSASIGDGPGVLHP